MKLFTTRLNKRKNHLVEYFPREQEKDQLAQD